EGTLSVQVAHDQRSAEEIFRIVHRLLENLPESLRQGALVTSRANVRQIVFPMLDSEYRVETAADPNAGRGLTIHNLHCSEVARWPRDVSETLASLRAARARSFWSPPPTALAAPSTTSGSALRKPATSATSIPGGGTRIIAARWRSSSLASRSASSCTSTISTQHKSPFVARCAPTSAIARPKNTPKIRRAVSSPPAIASSIATSWTSACNSIPRWWR